MIAVNLNKINDIARRFPENPIIRPADIRPSVPSMKVECLLNPGAFRYDGKICLLLRVAERPEQRSDKVSFPFFGDDGNVKIVEFEKSDPLLNLSDSRVLRYNGTDYLTTLSHLRIVESTDGIHFSEIPDSMLTGKGALEAYGIEDCRVAQINKRYFLTYTAVSSNGVGVGLRSTENWKDIKDHGLIMPPHNKDCALFEDTIGGKYFALHRPSSVAIGGNYIWIAESPDLIHWGNNKCIAQTRPHMWDSARIGAGASPILTDEGWLAIYHGADDANRYCLGALLLDPQTPSKVIARSKQPIMEPIAEYEKSGFFKDVVFTNGHVVDGDIITVYYGAADSVVCGAHFSIQEILDSLR